MARGKAKSPTEAAMRNRRESYIEERTKPVPVMASFFNRRAEALLELPAAPDVGAGGEVVRAVSLPDTALADVDPEQRTGIARMSIRDTLAQGATRVAEDASIRRTDLLLQSAFDCVALGVDAADSIVATNSLEKMLAHQMAAAHEAAMRLLNQSLEHQGRARNPADSVEACRMANAAARLMSAFQDGMTTLQRIRTGGKQTVTVQHVNVQPGGQAVVGTVQAGGPNYSGANRK